MASAPLNWLLKIGGDVLNTTAQTLSAAVNELKGLFSSINNMDDVYINSPVNDQFMRYNSTLHEWVNADYTPEVRASHIAYIELLTTSSSYYNVGQSIFLKPEGTFFTVITPISPGDTFDYNVASPTRNLKYMEPITNTLFGKGDMKSESYDPNSAVANVGGIPIYVSGQIANKADNSDLDEWIPSTTVSNGAFTFSDLDDTQGWGYKPFVNVVDSSINKNPSAQISSMSGSGTASMSVSYTTDADEGATVYLRVIK